MNQSELQERLKQIDSYAIALADGVQVMSERLYILEPLLRDDEVCQSLADRFHNTYGAHAYDHLAPLLGQDLVRELSRLFLYKDRRAGSMVNIHRKAADPVLNAALRERFASIPDGWLQTSIQIPGLTKEQSAAIHEARKKKDRERFGADFDKTWETVGDALIKIDADPVAEKIRTFRDKHHAHLEMAPLGSDPGPFDVSDLGLTYNDLFAFADRYIEPAFELIRILTGKVIAGDEFSRINKRSGQDMWRILAGLGALPDQSGHPAHKRISLAWQRTRRTACTRPRSPNVVSTTDRGNDAPGQ